MEMWTDAPDIAFASLRTFEREGTKYAFVVTVGIPGYLPESTHSYHSWENAAKALEAELWLTWDSLDNRDEARDSADTVESEIDGIWGVADDSEVSVEFGGYVHELHIVHHSDI